jgi:CubicO group peptidase (beta-lactamase class C family)
MIDQIRKDLQAAIDAHVFPGCVAGVYFNNQSQVTALGHLTYDNDSPLVTEDTIYDVASITKVIPVSSLALKLLNDNLLSTNDQLIRYLPQFSGSYRERILIHHLLTQTLSFKFRLSECKDMKSEEIMQKILTADFDSPPGTSFSYANATSILLGLVLEQCTGKTLDRAAEEYFFEPLSMNRTSFDASKFNIDMVVPTEIDAWRGKLIQGEVHDESAWVFRPRVVGSAGLFTTVPDLLKFVQMLIEEGTYAGRRFFDTGTINQMYTNQLSGKDQWTGLGWELCQKSFMGRFCSESAFGKTGFTGCSVVIDPLKKAAIVLLSNHTYPRRRSNRDIINKIRCQIADNVWKGL